MSVFLISSASSTVLPLTHSVAKEEEAIALWTRRLRALHPSEAQRYSAAQLHDTIGVWLGLIDDAVTSYRPKDVGWWDTFLEVGLNPGRSWWFAGFSWQDCANAWASADVVFWQRVTSSLAGAALYGAGAWLFWRLCCRRI